MRGFLQHAEDILDIATTGDTGLRDVVIVLDRQGGMRMLESAGWNLPALSAEYGASAVYRVERRGGAVRVEGWDGTQRCLLQRQSAASQLLQLPGMGSTPHARMLLPPTALTA